MSEIPRYWTRPFVEQWIAALNSSESFARAASRFSETLVFRCTDDPEGLDHWARYKFDRGKVVEWSFDSAPAPAPMRDEPFDRASALARSTASYALWCRLDRGEIHVAQALVSPEYKIDGSVLKLTWHLPTLNALSAVAATVPKRY